MLRRAREWQGEVQPVCPVDKLQAMRPAPELYGGGPSPVSWTGPVVMVQDELQQKKKKVEMNEKIFMGKVMEIKGRSLVVSREAFKWRSEPTNHVAEIFWEKLQLQRAIQGGLRAQGHLQRQYLHRRLRQDQQGQQGACHPHQAVLLRMQLFQQ